MSMGLRGLPRKREVVSGLVVFAGPPTRFYRMGIERGRTWLEEATGSLEVRGGDYPLPQEGKVAAVALLSEVTNAPRIEGHKSVAVDTQVTIEDWSGRGEEKMDEILDDGLDSLFYTGAMQTSSRVSDRPG